MATERSEKKQRLYGLVYGPKAKEYSFNGSVDAEYKMWNKFFDSLDGGKDQIAANVYRTLEENNWHSLTDKMDEEIDKPANERKGYFDIADTIYNDDRDRVDELRKLAKKHGATISRDRKENQTTSAKMRPSERARNTSIKTNPNFTDGQKRASRADNAFKANAAG